MKASQKCFSLFLSIGIVAASSTIQSRPSATEAPAGFDNKTNGFVSQATFDADRKTFEEREEIADGLGPVYNSSSCLECHSNPVTGSGSQIAELRAGSRKYVPSNDPRAGSSGFGHFGDRVDLRNSIFVDHPGGSLIHSRALDASIQEKILPGNDVTTFRMSVSTLGDGFVESVDDSVFINLAAAQAAATNGKIAGQVIKVPVLEAASNTTRVGRFGWKNQHASLVSFSSDAYLNEMGITSPLQPHENSSNGNSVAEFDQVKDPEDDGNDVRTFAEFIRSTKVPPRDLEIASKSDAKAGEDLFQKIGCVMCHVQSLTTAAPGTVINGGAFVVPDALGNKIIHPFSDYLLHDIGTGDGIVQNGGQSTAYKVRTVPLWGLRTRNLFMHDGLSLTLEHAIYRHHGEASDVTARYHQLRQFEQNQILLFLSSL